MIFIPVDPSKFATRFYMLEGENRTFIYVIPPIQDIDIYTSPPLDKTESKWETQRSASRDRAPLPHMDMIVQ
jgi:hypothetical protein